MTPEDIAALRDTALELTQPMIDYLLQDICRRVAKAGEITDTAEYQIYRAQALGASKSEIKKAIKAQTQLSDQAVSKMFRYVSEADVKFEENESLQKIVKAYADEAQKAAAQVVSDLHAVDPDGNVKPLEDVYGSCMDYAFKQTVTGAADYETALRQATRKLVQRGFRVIQQNDRSIGVEYATRRNLMDAMGRLDQRIMDMNHDELGCDGWEISAHAASAPDHEPYQGRQYTDKEFETLNNSLQRRIGTLSCKHSAFPIILGVNSPQYSEAQLQAFQRDNETGVTYEGRHYTMYEATQTQAGIENEIRYLKSSILADQTLGDEKRLQTDQIRLARMKEEYYLFSRGTGLPTRNERLQVSGFGHSEAAKAVNAYNKSAGIYEAPQIMAQYQSPSGSFDLEKAQQEYLGALTSFPERNRIPLQVYAQNSATSFLETQSLNSTFAYDPNTDMFLYNTKAPGFQNIDFEWAYTHELAHRFDELTVQSPKNKQFKAAIAEAKLDVQKNLLIYEKIAQLAPHGEISDIVSALSDGSARVPFAHEKNYWKQNPTAAASEIFAELFTMETFRWDKELTIVKKAFPQIWEAYSKLY